MMHHFYGVVTMRMEAGKVTHVETETRRMWQDVVQMTVLCGSQMFDRRARRVEQGAHDERALGLRDGVPLSVVCRFGRVRTVRRHHRASHRMGDAQSGNDVPVRTGHVRRGGGRREEGAGGR